MDFLNKTVVIITILDYYVQISDTNKMYKNSRTEQISKSSE